MNHSRNTTLERSDWCLNRFLVATTLALSSAVVYTRHFFSPLEGFLTHQCNISENIKKQQQQKTNEHRDETMTRTRQQEIPETLEQKKINSITETFLYNFDPLKPNFYIVKLGFTGVYIIFLYLLKHRLWVLVRTASPRRF